MKWLDAKTIKNWRPIALFLLGAAVISAANGYFGLVATLRNLAFPNPAYTVVVGYFHLNGQSHNAEMLSVGDDDADIKYFDLTLNVSRATFATERYVEECGDLVFSEVRGYFRITTSIWGSSGYASDGEVEIVCGMTELVVDLLSQPSMDTHTMGQEFYSFSGLFEVSEGYTMNTISRVYLREIEIPPAEENVLRGIARELWEQVGPAV